ASYGDGFGRVNGRVNDLLYAPQTKKLYAAVAQGGVWESEDQARSWHPIGDTLPIGSTGAIGWTPANGGTLIVATGDHAFSNDYAGVGVYWSVDDGVTWVKAKGAPDGALSYRVAVDPTNPRIVYVATGLGLYRSTDGGRSFTNVRLPTGDCAGYSTKPNCFFANIVTDVAVQPADRFGHHGGGAQRDLRLQGLRPHLDADGRPSGLLQPGQRLVAVAAGGPRHRPGLPGQLQRVDQAGPVAHRLGRRADAPAVRHGGGLD